MDKCNNTFKYLDDVLAFINLEVQTFAKEIYPKELTLNKSNISNDSAPFLDLDLKMNKVVFTLNFMIQGTIIFYS